MVEDKAKPRPLLASFTGLDIKFQVESFINVAYLVQRTPKTAALVPLNWVVSRNSLVRLAESPLTKAKPLIHLIEAI